ncbi:MAG: site-specific DNA-methyltransferase [Pirellulaceae bacterium]
MQKLTAQDPETKSRDLVAENIEQLKALFPEAFTEGKVDFEVLKQVLGGIVDDGEEKYGLNWHGKRRARKLALTPSTGTLRPCPEDSVDWDTTQNLMIEGDNLEVLKLLQKSYAGKVKLIYIDPPYNTGKDFVYPDDFRDNVKNYLELTGQVEGGRKISSNTEASGRFHTDWLNMMYPRLKLARTLLREDGVILISIDDHEVDNLRRVCNEVFGEENFVACMVWEKGRKNDAKLVSVGHEYVLLFAKSLGLLRETKTIWREEKPGAREIWEKYLELRRRDGDNNAIIETHLQAWYSSLPKTHPSKKWSRYKRVDANGPWRDRDISWPGGGGPRYEVLHPRTNQPCKVPEDGWRFSKPEEMQRQINLGLVEFREDHTEPPFRKAHIRPIPAEIEADTEAEEGDSDEAGEEEFATQVRGSYFYKQSQVAVKFLRTLLGAKVFDNPKDHFELAKLFDYATANDSNAIVLDFFAGSGSTGHAVIDLNQADDGSRRFLLVQLPEPLDPDAKDQKVAAKYCDQLGRPRTIAELTKERLRRAGTKIREDKPMFPGDLGFRVFKLDSSNIRAWDPDRGNLPKTLEESVEHLKTDRTEADILFELLLKLGLDLTVPIQEKTIAGKAVHSIGAGTLLVCLAAKVDSDEVEPLAQGIAAWHREQAPAGESQVVFRDSAFANDVAKTNLTAILSQHGLENVRSL